MPKTKTDIHERSNHVILASQGNLRHKETLPIVWGAKDPLVRGPVVASSTNAKARNAIGTHGGS
jgi:hypothetical protein